MSDYMLGKISRHLADIKHSTSRPSGVPLSQYNDLVGRFNEMSRAYAQEVEKAAYLTQLVDYHKRDAEKVRDSWDALKAKALEIENDLRADNERLRAMLDSASGMK